MLCVKRMSNPIWPLPGNNSKSLNYSRKDRPSLMTNLYSTCQSSKRELVKVLIRKLNDKTRFIYISVKQNCYNLL